MTRPIMTRPIMALMAVPVLISAVGYGVSLPAIAQSSDQPTQTAPRSKPQRQGQRPHRGPDFAAAAKKLGISEATLKAALGIPANPPDPSANPGQRPPRPDFKAAAAKLGITEQKLVEALGMPKHPRPNFAAAAQKLGVSEADLKTALGVPANPPDPSANPGQRPPRPDFPAAAAKLGVTEQQLMEALGMPPHPPEGDNQPDGARPQ